MNNQEYMGSRKSHCMSFTEMNMASRWGHRPANQTVPHWSYMYKTHAGWMLCFSKSHLCQACKLPAAFHVKKQPFIICAFYHMIMSMHTKTCRVSVMADFSSALSEPLVERWGEDSQHSVCDTVACCQSCHKLSHMNIANALCTIAHQLTHVQCLSQTKA